MTEGLRRHLRRDNWMLIAFVAVLAALLLFLKLSSEIMEGETDAFDRYIVEGLRNATSGDGRIDRWLRLLMLDLTALGDSATLILLTGIAAGYLAVVGHVRTAILLCAMLAVGSIVETALKQFFARARPDVVEHLVAVSTASFPSGHAMRPAMVYLTIAAILARGREPAPRVYIVAVAIALVLSIGISRIYLGVHWPTDVLGGWIVGGAWAALCSVGALRLAGRAPAGGSSQSV